MAFATRADLLACSNARRLAQLAVPADMAMPPEDALRVAVAGSDLTAYTSDAQVAIAAALGAIDKALADAGELIESYGVSAAWQTSLLARMASTIALYYLQGAERMTDDVRKAYDAEISNLKAHARGEMNLGPATAPDPAAVEDVVFVESGAARYSTTSTDGDW